MEMNDHLIEQYKLLYEQKPSYGASSQKIFNIVLQVINQYKPNTILDYGCGRSRLLDMISEQIDVNIFKYDPVFEMYSQLPKQKVDFVICTDVLQHVPELELFDNLFEISQLGDKCFFKIKCSDHPTCLPNGEPTNCTVHDKQWWKNFLYKYYSSIEEIFCSDSSSVIFLAKN